MPEAAQRAFTGQPLADAPDLGDQVVRDVRDVHEDRP